MKTVQKNRDGHFSGFSYSYSSPSGEDKQWLTVFFVSARQVAMVLIAALMFTTCKNFISIPPVEQTGQSVPSFNDGNQNILTIEPQNLRVSRGTIVNFRAMMGDYVAGAEWSFAGEVSLGTKIINGELVVAEDESHTEIIIIATSRPNNKYQARAIVIIE
jgi:hypothetical protein